MSHLEPGGLSLELTDADGGRGVAYLYISEGELVIKGSAAGTTVNVFGENNQVTMTGGSLVMAEGAELDLAGRGNMITMLGEGELHASDRGQRVEVYGDNNQAWVNGSTVTEHGTADIDLYGTANSLRATSQRPDQLLREQVVFDRFAKLMDSVWDAYEDQRDDTLSQLWRDFRQPAMPLADGVASVDPLWNADSVQSQDAQPWLTANASSPLTSRPLIAAAGSSSTSGSSGSSGLFS